MFKQLPKPVGKLLRIQVLHSLVAFHRVPCTKTPLTSISGDAENSQQSVIFPVLIIPFI
jgi:hypothetical protein